ncbi:hypothetical protein [Amorphus sp. 3PC139-8]|uniref:hypothetical protein n=1 Tax=Amorphus sp. 3PC139-8 TaxID=2735676 RepID=UPI00345D1BE3
MEEELDFSDLSDDQVVDLVTALCAEAARRGAATDAAARASILDEAERIRIARDAMAEESGRLRYAERSRVAEAARAHVRATMAGKPLLTPAEIVEIEATARAMEEDAMRAEARERVAQAAREDVRRRDEAAAEAQRRQAAERAAAEARAVVAAKQAREMALLREIAAIVDQDPAEISVIDANTRRGRRIMINLGQERYTHDHLADYSVTTGEISTKRDLIRRKPDLAGVLAGYAASGAPDRHLVGADYPWSAGT